MTRCEGHYINYLRGTSAGSAGQCTATAKVCRNGKHYCLRHDPDAEVERRKRRDERADAKYNADLKTFQFRVTSSGGSVIRMYELPAPNLTVAKDILIEKLMEAKIEYLGTSPGANFAIRDISKQKLIVVEEEQ